jgi:GT2 family glycosyltransferase
LTSKKENIIVSIIVLNCNGAKFLKKLLHSLSLQTFKNFEIIFVDNKSTDDSLLLLRELCASEIFRNLHIRIIRNDTNLGFCGGNNEGLRYIKGQYVVFLNNDTYVSQDWLEELVNSVLIHPSVGAFQSVLEAPFSHVQNAGGLMDKYGWTSGTQFPNKIKNTICLKDPFYLSGASMIISKSLLTSIGSFDPQLFFGDYDICWRLRICGYPLSTATKSVCYHYGSKTTKSLIPQVELAYHRYRETIRVFIKNYSIGNALKRIPQSISLMFMESTYVAFKFRNPYYLLTVLKAALWNLQKFNDSFIARSKVQKLRRISDSEIEGYMLHYPLVFIKSRTP